MFEWISLHETILWWFCILSLLTFVGTLIVIPVLVIRIPPHYFINENRKSNRFDGKHPVIRFLFHFFKNLFGIVFILTGLTLLFLPGQGFITILIGIMLIDFPKKHVLERRIIQQPAILKTINWMRIRAHHLPLKVSKKCKTGKSVSLKVEIISPE